MMFVCAGAGEVLLYVGSEGEKILISSFPIFPHSLFLPLPLSSLPSPHQPSQLASSPFPLPISPNCIIPYPSFFYHPLNPSIPFSPPPSPPPFFFFSYLIRLPTSSFPSRPRNSPAAVPLFGPRDLKLRLPALFRPRGWLAFRAIWGFTRIRVSLVLAGAGWLNRFVVWD